MRGWFVASLVLVALSSMMSAWALSARSADDRRARERADRDRVALLVRSAALRYASGDPFSARAMVRAALEVRDDVAARALLEALRSEPLRWVAASEGFAYAVTYDREGSHVYAAMQAGELLAIDDASGEARVLHRASDQCLDVVPYRSGVLWTTASGEVFSAPGPQGPVRRIRTFSSAVRLARVVSDGRVALLLLDRRVVVIDPDGGRSDRWIALPSQSMSAIAASPITPRIAVGGFGGQLWFVDLSREDPPTSAPLGEPAGALAFSRDGRAVYVGHPSGMISQVEDGRVTRESAGSSTMVRSIAELDARTLLVAGFRGGEVSILDRTSGERRTLLSHVDVNGLAVTGVRAVVAQTRGVTGLWLDHTAVPQDLPRSPTVSVHWSPDGERLYVGSEGIQTWRARDGALLRVDSLGSEHFPRELSVSRDGRLAMWLPGRGAVILDGRNGATRAAVSNLSVQGGFDVDWTRDRLAFGTDTGTVLAARVSDGTLLSSLRSHSSAIQSVRLVPGRDEVDILSEGVVSRWDYAQSTQRARRDLGLRVRDLRPDPSGRYLAAAGVDGFAVLLDRETLDLRVTLQGARGRLHVGAWSPDGRTFAAPSSDGTVYLWAIEEGPAGPVVAGPRTIRAHEREANAVAFDPTGTWLASVGDDGTSRVFDARTGAPRWRPTETAPAPSGLSIRDGRVVDAQGRPRPVRPGVGALRAAPVEEQIAVGYESGAVELWSGGASRRLEGGPSVPVRWLQAAPFGTVFAGFEDGRACVWHARSGVRIGCRSLNGPIAFGLADARSITAVSVLGDRARISLDSLERPWCALLRELWREQPWVWSGDAQRRSPPPAEHPCR